MCVRLLGTEYVVEYLECLLRITERAVEVDLGPENLANAVGIYETKIRQKGPELLLTLLV